MDSLSDLLGQKNFDEPPEVTSIKKYIYDTFKHSVTIAVRQNELIITTGSAALANTLRLRSPEIKRRCQTDKRLVFRIG